MSLPPDLSIQEAAHARGVTTKTVRRWIAQGLVPAYRVGPRLIRIREDDLKNLSRRIPSARSGAA